MLPTIVLKCSTTQAHCLGPPIIPVRTFQPNSTMYGCNKMTDELELIERLCRLRCVLYTKPDLADSILVKMIEEAEEKVHAFEHEFELEMDDGA